MQSQPECFNTHTHTSRPSPPGPVQNGKNGLSDEVRILLRFHLQLPGCREVLKIRLCRRHLPASSVLCSQRRVTPLSTSHCQNFLGPIHTPGLFNNALNLYLPAWRDHSAMPWWWWVIFWLWATIFDTHNSFAVSPVPRVRKVTTEHFLHLLQFHLTGAWTEFRPVMPFQDENQTTEKNCEKSEFVSGSKVTFSCPKGRGAFCQGK